MNDDINPSVSAPVPERKLGERYIARDSAVYRTSESRETTQHLVIVFGIGFLTVTRLPVSASAKGLLLLLLLAGAYMAVKARKKDHLVIAVRDGHIQLPKQSISVELEGIPPANCRPIYKPIGDLAVSVKMSFVILVSRVPGQPGCWVVDDLGTPEFAQKFAEFLVEFLALTGKPAESNQWPPAPVTRPDAS